MRTVACCIAILISYSGFSQIDFNGAKAQSNSILDDLNNKVDVVGVSVSVGYQDSIIYSKGFGYADNENKIEVETYHKFRIYSLSKHLAAIAAAKLSEKGVLDLDAPIESIMPLLHQNMHGITARELIGHTSGIRAYGENEWQLFADGACQSPFEAMLLFQADPLEFAPGTDFGYTTYGYVVLSALIEKVTGQPFMEYLNSELFFPNGITQVTLDNADKTDHLAAKPYEYWQEVMYNARYANNTCKFGGGALSASPSDIVLFNLKLLSDQVVKTETREMIFKSLKLDNGEATQYGFGLEFATDAAGRSYAWHSGRSRGGRNSLVIYPQEKLVVCISSNTNGDSIVKEAEKIAQHFLDVVQ